MFVDLIRFEDFELDGRNYYLRRSGANLKMERIPMELLLLLVGRAGELVTREQIIEKLWGKDVYLDTENAINTAIRKIRLALGDDPAQPRFVQTVTGRGYRFIAEVVSQGSSAARKDLDGAQFVSTAAAQAGQNEGQVLKPPADQRSTGRNALSGSCPDTPDNGRRTDFALSARAKKRLALCASGDCRYVPFRSQLYLRAIEREVAARLELRADHQRWPRQAGTPVDRRAAAIFQRGDSESPDACAGFCVRRGDDGSFEPFGNPVPHGHRPEPKRGFGRIFKSWLDNPGSNKITKPPYR